jgi:hypothetical protein
MSLAFTHLTANGTNSPGVGSQATISLSPVSGRAYIVIATQLTTSANPVTATLTGWGQTFTSVIDYLWIAAGANGRRLQMWIVNASSPSAGALTFHYTTDPNVIDWSVTEVTGHGATLYVSGNVQSVSSTYVGGVLDEEITMNTAASVNNRWFAVATCNANSVTNRFEKAADSGGEADWDDLGEFSSSTGKTRGLCTAWLNAAPATDVTPGFMNGTTGNYAMVAIEVVALSTTNIQSVNGVAYASIAFVNGLAIASIAEISGLA